MSDRKPFDHRPYRSVSQLKTYTECSMKYKLIKVDKKPVKGASWTVRGIAVHESIEMWELSNRELDAATYCKDVAWPNALEKMTLDYPDIDSWIKTPNCKTTSSDLKLREKESPEHVSVYLDRALREEKSWRPWRQNGEVVMAEVGFKLETFEDFVLVGFIDQIIEWDDGTFTIKDIKSGKDTYEDYRQLGIYAYAANEMFPELNIQYGTYWYTKLDRDCGMINLKRYDRNYLQRSFGVLNSGIEAGVYLANPNAEKCKKFCAVKEWCSEWS